MWLQAQAPDNLFKRRIIALSGDGVRCDRDLGRFGNVLAVDTTQPETCLRERM